MGIHGCYLHKNYQTNFTCNKFGSNFKINFVLNIQSSKQHVNWIKKYTLNIFFVLNSYYCTASMIKTISF
jgi:hypothetical protein